MNIRRHLLPLCSVVLLFSATTSCQTKWQGKKIHLPKISKEIISLRKNDQKYRMKWLKLNAKGEQETEKFKKITEKLINIDRSNTARMEEIVEKHGWPTFEKVGEEASNVAWLIVQHADRNPFFQEKCLELMKQALKEHQINPSNYAYLYDRVQLARGEKQLYATQSTTNHNINAKISGFQPIEDESNVQKRREEMNIEQHIEHYALSLNFDYRVPSEQEAVEKAKKFEDAYKIHIQRAKEAMGQGNYEDAALHYLNALNSDGYTKAEDYVEAARAMSLAKHDEIGLASFYLIKAAFKGYPEIAQVDKDPDFNYLKTESPDFWEHDLMKVIHTAQKH